MIKLIFLDIDGVLISNAHEHDNAIWDPRCMSNLGLILKTTQAKIIMSSSWRRDTLLDTIILLEEKGFEFCKQIIGITIRAHQYINRSIHHNIPRGVEIKQYIDTHIHSNNGRDFLIKKIHHDYNYLILDDQSNLLLEQKYHHIPVDKTKGLTFENAVQAIAILNYVK